MFSPSPTESGWLALPPLCSSRPACTAQPGTPPEAVVHRNQFPGRFRLALGLQIENASAQAINAKFAPGFHRGDGHALQARPGEQSHWLMALPADGLQQFAGRLHEAQQHRFEHLSLFRGQRGHPWRRHCPLPRTSPTVMHPASGTAGRLPCGERCSSSKSIGTCPTSCARANTDRLA